jgi:DNA ligase-associated metallophosphoesterase
MIIQHNELNIELLPERALFLPGSNTLIISDLHLGKATHFRKSGIVLPMDSIQQDYMRLNLLIERKQPFRVLIIGDLFHSSHNKEWDVFCEFVADNSSLEFVLIRGNHDVLSKKHYEQACMRVIDKQLMIGELLLTHEPVNEVPPGCLNIAGHIHPGYALQGRGKQRITLPCFYKRGNCLVLPAFGSLTGLQLLEKNKSTEVYVIANDRVIEI